MKMGSHSNDIDALFTCNTTITNHSIPQVIDEHKTSPFQCLHSHVNMVKDRVTTFTLFIIKIIIMMHGAGILLQVHMNSFVYNKTNPTAFKEH